MKYVNQRGFPCIKSVDASATDDILTIIFPTYSGLPHNFSGGFWMNIPLNFAREPFLKTLIKVEGGIDHELLTSGGGLVGDSQLTGPGIYLAFYDKESDTIRII